jgi:G:T/U-mismatch repair DNA glycosylase
MTGNGSMADDFILLEDGEKTDTRKVRIPNVQGAGPAKRKKRESRKHAIEVQSDVSIQELARQSVRCLGRACKARGVIGRDYCTGT